MEDPTLPKTRFPWITHASLSCEVDPVAQIRLHTAPNAALCPDGHTLDFRRFGARRLRHRGNFPRTKRIDAPLLAEQGLDWISGAVTMDGATFTTFLALARGASVMSWFNCRALLDTGSLQSFIWYGCRSFPM